MSPITLALVYVVSGLVVVPLVFAIFRTPYQFVDVAIASVGAGAASFIPSFGGIASLVVMLGVLYWRMRDSFFPDVVVAAVAARLAMVPVLLALRLPAH